MKSKARADRYDALSISMHWLMVLLIVGVYASINLSELYPTGSEGHARLDAVHVTLGLSIFVLVFSRLGIRPPGPAPEVKPPISLTQRRLNTAMQVALYVFMIVMPLLGWLVLSAAGRPIPFFEFDVPALWSQDLALADKAKGIHETIGMIGYLLIGLHAANALFRHYVVRDNTLLRILPNRHAQADSHRDKSA